MSGEGLKAVAIAALAAAAIVGAAKAQTDAAPAAGAAAKLKPKAHIEQGLTVTVTNQRKVGLAELDAARAGSPAFKPIVKKLGPGAKTVITLPSRDDCLFDLHVRYDDGDSNDVSNFDVCRDGKINLVE